MDHLQTEGRNPASANLDELSPLDLVRLMNAEDANVIPAVASQAEAIARGIEVIADRLRAGGRLVYAGAGTSGRLGVLDATECPPTFNAPVGQVVGVIAGGKDALTRAVEGAEDHPELGVSDLVAIQFSAKDVLVGIATSGRTPYVLGAVEHARSLGAFTIGLSCNADSELIPVVDLAITPVVGPEILSGSTRLKAGTATKLVLNMLTTGAMVRLGKAYGNLMVDLRATNEKLRARTNRIVRHLTSLTHQQADELLEKCGRELKTALVSQLASVSAEEARLRLQKADGQVRKALGPSSDSSKTVAAKWDDLVLGIDGGGTHTIALLARATAPEQWTILGRGEGGPSNVTAVGPQRAFASLDEAVARAFAAAGFTRGAVRAACLGLAGAGRAEEQAVIKSWAERAGLAVSVTVMGDTPLLLAAGTPDGWGVAVVAGTGSMVFAQAPDGRTTRVGGWGYLLGDEGSGYALALGGLQAVTRAADGRAEPTALTSRFLHKLGLSEPSELIKAVYQKGMDKTALAALAPLVLEAAEAGDKTAGEIVALAATDLVVMITTAARRLNLGEGPIPLTLAGGVILASASYREYLLELLASQGFEADPVTLVDEPAQGAVRLARALA